MIRLTMLYPHRLARVDGRVHAQRADAHFLDAIAPHFARVVVLAPGSNGSDTPCRLASPNVDLLPLPFFETWLTSVPAMRAARALLRSALPGGADVVYMKAPSTLAMAGYSIVRRAGVPVCLHVVGDLLAALRPYGPLVRPFAVAAAGMAERWTMRVARRALVLAQGPMLAARYAAAGGRVVEVRESTVPAARLVSTARADLRRPVRLLFVGDLREKKGVEYLVEAVAHLREDLPVELTTVGVGEDRERLAALVARRGLERFVRFAGLARTDDELFGHYDAADVFVLPSLAEGFPRVLLEAMARGLPVVSTAVGGVPGIVRDGEHGLLVPAASAGALAKAVRRLIEDEALRRRIAANGLALARESTREAFGAAFARAIREYWVQGQRTERCRGTTQPHSHASCLDAPREAEHDVDESSELAGYERA